jgi:hypothetical protein
MNTTNQARRPARRKNTVNTRLTAKTARQAVENDEYAAFTRRILRAYARRIASGDIEALTLITNLGTDVENTIRDAVTGLRDHGYSLAEIGSRLGVTRQAAQQRWGSHT